jgi:phosphohistidine phosphatase
MKRLWLLRHAKSDWDTGAADFDRPLKKRGRKSADRLGAWLADRGEPPDRIITSPAARAVETLNRLCDAAGWSMDEVVEDRRLYGADIKDFRAVLSDHGGDAKYVMLVGHNPGLEDWLRYLVPDITTPEDGKLLPTAALASLGINADWTNLESGCAQLDWLQRVRDLQS